MSEMERALQIHLEEMDFSDIEDNADYHARLIGNIVRPYIKEDYIEENKKLREMGRIDRRCIAKQNAEAHTLREKIKALESEGLRNQDLDKTYELFCQKVVVPELEKKLQDLEKISREGLGFYKDHHFNKKANEALKKIDELTGKGSESGD